MFLQIVSHLPLFLILRLVPLIPPLLVLYPIQSHITILETEPQFMHPTGLVFSLLVLLLVNHLLIKRLFVFQLGSRLCLKSLHLCNVLVLESLSPYLHMLFLSHVNGCPKLKPKLMVQLNDTKLA